MIQNAPRLELLQGTLELLILRTLLAGPTHGHAIANIGRGARGRVSACAEGIVNRSDGGAPARVGSPRNEISSDSFTGGHLDLPCPR